MPERPTIAVVTGAARGIGLATARRLVADGHEVLRLDLVHADLEATTQDGFRDLVVDVADGDALAAAVASLGDRQVSVGIANAGIQRDARINTMSLTEWDEVIAVDLTAAWLLLRTLWPSMRDHGRGAFVLLSSIAKDGNFGQANYAAAKSGLVGLARTAAIEGGPYGITTNVVCPGVIDTPGTADFRARAPEAFDRFTAGIPARRVGTPEDVAGVVSFLVSRDAAYVSGQVVYVDGGLSSGHS